MGLIMLSLSLYSIYAIIVDNPGRVGIILRFILGLLFGQGSILFSIFFIWTSGYLIIKSKFFEWNRKIIAFIIMAINYCILQYLFIVKNILLSPLDSNIFFIAWENAPLNIGGGIIGLLFSSILVSLFSQIGALMFLIFSSIIAIIMITQKSLKDFTTTLVNKIQKWFREVKNKVLVFITKPKVTEGKENSKKDISSNSLRNKIDQLDEKIRILDYTQEEKISPNGHSQKLNSTTKEEDREELLNISYVSNTNIANY